jgi:protein-tyrosine phosphatase
MTAAANSGVTDPRPTRVLFVCLGNICRSPAAEGVFLNLLAQQGLEDSFMVDSAGTGGWHVGNPADARMRRAAERRGIHLHTRARQVEMADLQEFDHILTMDDDNLHALRELSKDKPIRARIEPLMAYARRSGSSEVPDPYYGGREGFEHVLDLLEDACGGLLSRLYP